MSRINIVSKRTATPSPWNGQLICIPIEGIPAYLSAIWLKSQKYWWLSSSEKDGRQIMNEGAVAMLLGCGKEITERLDRLYTLLDGVYNGNNYTGERDEETGELIITPALPLVAANSALYYFPGLRDRHDDTRDMLLNTLTGQAEGEYTNPRGTNVILEDILLALSTMSEEEQTELLQKIVLALGGVL